MRGMSFKICSDVQNAYVLTQLNTLCFYGRNFMKYFLYLGTFTTASLTADDDNLMFL